LWIEAAITFKKVGKGLFNSTTKENPFMFKTGLILPVGFLLDSGNRNHCRQGNCQ